MKNASVSLPMSGTLAEALRGDWVAGVGVSGWVSLHTHFLIVPAYKVVNCSFLVSYLAWDTT